MKAMFRASLIINFGDSIFKGNGPQLWRAWRVQRDDAPENCLHAPISVIWSEVGHVSPKDIPHLFLGLIQTRGGIGSGDRGVGQAKEAKENSGLIIHYPY